MNAPALAELAVLKQGARAAWAAGDYHAIAERQLWEVGPRIVQAVGVQPGEHVLDIACGTGNATLRAAQAGAEVVGVDLTPELFDAGRRLAADAGAQIEWVQGDAENLPFDDETLVSEPGPHSATARARSDSETRRGAGLRDARTSSWSRFAVADTWASTTIPASSRR
jgi:SAM-dependent methyltransferase